MEVSEIMLMLSTNGALAAAAALLAVVMAVLALVNGSKLKKVRQAAFVDPITGGTNGAGLRQAAERLCKNGYGQYSLVSMEVQNYTDIGKTFGSEESRKVLVHIHNVLKASLSSEEPVGRMAGDVFYFLLKNRQEDEVRARLKRIYDTVNRFNDTRKDAYYIRLVFGIYTPDRDSREDLLEIQGKAAEARKTPGSDLRYRFYDKKSAQNASQRDPRDRELVNQVDRALQNRDFVVYLQPKVRMGDRRIAGAEALVRWKHPERGMLASGAFMPLLEEYHMISRLDRYLFEEVCRTLARWKGEGRELCPVSVNLSREHLEIPDFVEQYDGICRKYEVAPGLIEFELPETMLLENPKKVRAVIEELHSYGFQCALDDFGKQYIPLDLLRELDVDAIKLDRSFFYGENNNRRNRYIIEAILKLAAQLHIRTIAEGIDNASQVQYLQQAACDMIQGYYYFKPMSVEEFERTAYQDGILRYVEAEGARTGQRKAPAQQSAADSSIVMFSYAPDEDRVVFSALFSPALGGQLVFSNAQALFRGSELIHENDRDDFFLLLERCRREDGWVRNTLRFYMSEGRYEWLEVHLHEDDGRDPDGESIISGTLVNMAGWKGEVDRWKEKANRDALTGLFNREYFEHFASTQMERDNLPSAAIVFIDIDDFKHVNDTLGHMFGDDVLCCVAKRILGVFRHTDVAARYGGDEFVVFVSSISRETLEERLRQLCEVFRYPYRNETVEYKISGSIGGAMYPADGSDYETLLDHADCALYEAKKRGKDQYVLYEPYMESAPPKEETSSET